MGNYAPPIASRTAIWCMTLGKVVTVSPPIHRIVQSYLNHGHSYTVAERPIGLSLFQIHLGVTSDRDRVPLALCIMQSNTAYSLVTW